MKSDIIFRFAPPIAALLIRALYATLRVRHAHADRILELNRREGSYIFAFWHAHLLVMIYALFRHPLLVMISQHRDGEMIAATMGRFGVTAARGSTTRGGGEALRQMVRGSREGYVLVLTPDGPRGPRRIAQPGVVRAAQLAGIPILPAAVVARNRKVLSSWDRFEIPLPFARTLFHYGEPIEVPRNLSDEEFERTREQVERRITGLADEAEQDFDRLWNAAVPLKASPPR